MPYLHGGRSPTRHDLETRTSRGLAGEGRGRVVRGRARGGAEWCEVFHCCVLNMCLGGW